MGWREPLLDNKVSGGNREASSCQMTDIGIEHLHCIDYLGGRMENSSEQDTETTGLKAIVPTSWSTTVNRGSGSERMTKYS